MLACQGSGCYQLDRYVSVYFGVMNIIRLLKLACHVRILVLFALIFLIVLCFMARGRYGAHRSTLYLE